MWSILNQEKVKQKLENFIYLFQDKPRSYVNYRGIVNDKK